MICGEEGGAFAPGALEAQRIFVEGGHVPATAWSELEGIRVAFLSLPTV